MAAQSISFLGRIAFFMRGHTATKVWPVGHLLSSHEERRQRRTKGEPLGTPLPSFFVRRKKVADRPDFCCGLSALSAGDGRRRSESRTARDLPEPGMCPFPGFVHGKQAAVVSVEGTEKSMG